MKYQQIAIYCLLMGASTVTFAWDDLAPRSAPTPPPTHFGVERPSRQQAAPKAMASGPSTEWSYHRTSDGQHPNGDEQALLWLMNRARQNPAAEGQWLTTATEPDIADGRNYFGVNTSILQNEFASYAATPPAAFDVRLYQAAKAHSDDLIARDAQDHNGQTDRLGASGFPYAACRYGVFSYAESALNAHAAWNIDWGPGDSSGMQPDRPHRLGLMSLNNDYTNTGLAAVPENNAATQVGPLVTSSYYCRAQANGSNAFNAFIVGTVWRDNNNNGRYDPGEGYSNVMVRPDRGNYYANTSAGGGYAIPITTTGTLTINFSGSGVAATNRTVTVGGNSVLVDYLVSDTPTIPTPPTSSTTKLSNISTRGWVGTGDSVMIGGFIINGTTPKKVLITAKGPSLASAGVPSVLNDPNVTLYNGSGQTIASNDNWEQAPNVADIQTRNAKPRDSREAAILTTLNPGAYTAIVRGAGSSTGNAIVEVFDIDATASRLINISTRGWVGTGDSVMIGGFIINGTTPKKVLITAKGPSLASAGVPSVLNDPNVTLYNGSGQTIASNDNWEQAPNIADIQTRNAKPRDSREAAILTTLNPGAYTAIVRGAGSSTGNAIVEVYEIQ